MLKEIGIVEMHCLDLCDLGESDCIGMYVLLASSVAKPDVHLEVDVSRLMLHMDCQV